MIILSYICCYRDLFVIIQSMTEGLPQRREPREGVDYLINYYSVLDVARDASGDDVKAAYRGKIVLYHEDKYAHLAPEFREQAKIKTRILGKASEILSNETSRREYDERLDSWKGLISKDGTPIISMKLGPAHFLGKDEDPNQLNSLLEQARTLSGYNPTIFGVIRDQYVAHEDPPSDLERAYAEVLGQRDLFLSTEDSFRRDFAGLDNAPAVTSSPNLLYLESARSEIATGREGIVEGVEHTLFQLRSGELQAIGPGADSLRHEMESDSSAALERYKEVALDRYDRDTSEIERVAGERQEVIEERLRILKGEYLLGQNKLTDRLIVAMEIGDEQKWFSFKLEDGSVQQEDIPDEVLEELSDPKKVEEKIKEGYSIMKFAHQHGLPIIESLQEVVSKHYVALLSTD